MNFNGSPSIDSKEPETPDDPLLIPSDVLLPSSLLPDLMPSGSMRRGPLYNRDSRKQSTPVNGLVGSNGPTVAEFHNKMAYRRPSSPSAVTVTPGYSSSISNNYASSMMYAEQEATAAFENPYARMNGDHHQHQQLQQPQHYYDSVPVNKLAGVQAVRSFGQNTNASIPADYSAAKKLIPKGPGPWNLATNSPFVNGNGAECGDVNNSMTYAAALRQTQQKLAGIREYDCKSTFEF